MKITASDSFTPLGVAAGQSRFGRLERLANEVLGLIQVVNDTDLRSAQLCVIAAATAKLERDLEVAKKSLELGGHR